MPIDPATGEEAEDLTKVEWGAGLARMMRGQIPNMLFVGLGFSCLALPSYLATGWNETHLSNGTEIVFPIVSSSVVLALCGVALHTLSRGRESLPLSAHTSPVTPLLTAGWTPAAHLRLLNAGGAPAKWTDALGFAVGGGVQQRCAERVALIAATLGDLGCGWVTGLSTFCAYDKAHDLDVYWEECYEVSRAWKGVDDGVVRAATLLPASYFTALLLALLLALFGPLVWCIAWKGVRACVRPIRPQQRSSTPASEPERALRELPQTAMLVLALAVGVISGSGAWVFRQMIGLVHNVLFMQQGFLPGAHGPQARSWPASAFYYDANAHTPPPAFGMPQCSIILAPILGGLVVAFLVQNWAPEAKGHGVPEVVDAIHYKRGLIGPSVALTKIVASSFSIGSGGSVGREGPIIQIGSTFGSMVGKAAGCSVSQRVTLIACGAAGGIAATFNTPIGGVVFAVELMLPAINSRTLMPLGLTSVVATYIGRWALGLHPAFDVPQLQAPQASIEDGVNLLFFLPFGVLVGLASVLFVKGIYWSEDFFEAMPGNYYSRHTIGMLAQGLLIYLLMAYSGGHGEPGHYYVQGVGYATIRDVLSWEPDHVHNHTQPAGQAAGSASGSWGGAAAASTAETGAGISNPPFCALLFVCKLLSTCVTIGSGASGGIFSPSLFLGATLGGVWGHVIAVLDPSAVFRALGDKAAFDPIQACVAGMAGMVGSSTGASVTAIAMTYEMTRDYSTILPVIITTVLAYTTRKALSEGSIYTLKLVRRGHVVPEGLQAAVHAAQRVKHAMTDRFRVLREHELLTRYDGTTLVLQPGTPSPRASPSAPPTPQPPRGAAPPIGAECDNLPDVVGGLCVCAALGPVQLDYRRVLGVDLPAAAACGGGAHGGAVRTAGQDDDLHDAMRRMTALGAEVLLVLDDPAAPPTVGNVLGVVTRADVLRLVSEASQLCERDRDLELDAASWAQAATRAKDSQADAADPSFGYRPASAATGPMRPGSESTADNTRMGTIN